MLYELRPDKFPEGHLTDAELMIWGWYYEEKHARSRSR